MWTFILSCLAVLCVMALVIKFSNKEESDNEIDFSNQQMPSIAPHFQKEFEEWQRNKAMEAMRAEEESESKWTEVGEWQVGNNKVEALEGIEGGTGTIAWELKN